MSTKTLAPGQSVKSLNPVSGDIIQIQAGTYPAMDFSGLSGVTFQAMGAVVFTGTITLGNTLNLLFDGSKIKPYGFKSTATGACVSPGVGNNQNITFKGFDFGNTAVNAFDSQTLIYINNKVLTYNGKPETLVFSNLVVDGFKIQGKTTLFSGPYPDNSTYQMVNSGLTFKNGVFVNDGTGENIKVRGASLYGVVADTWDISGPTINKNDCGIFYIQSGNAKISNIKRNGGWGYIARIWNAFLTAGDYSCIKNCIDVNSTHYGTVDIRIDPSPTSVNSKSSIPIYGGDFIFDHNTCGDKLDGPDDAGKGNKEYVSNAIILGPLVDETGKIFKITVSNNLAFNASENGTGNSTGSSLYKINTDKGTFVLVDSNNIDLKPGVALPVGYLVDKVNFVPVKGGPLNGKASDGSDIGAMQLGTVVTPPPVIVPPPVTVPPKQRSVVSVTPKVTTSYQVTYDDGSSQTL